MEEIIRDVPAVTTITDEETKEIRKQEWREAIESELQPLILQAVSFRKNIKEAKTNIKKSFFEKKFKKIKVKINKYVVLLDALGSKEFDECQDNMVSFAKEQEKKEELNDVTTIA